MTNSKFCPCCGYDLDTDKPIEFGPFSMDPYDDLYFENRAVGLTSPNQKAIVWSLLKAQGRAVSRETLHARIDYSGPHRIADNYISRIRKKLDAIGAGQIVSVMPHRYKFQTGRAHG